MSHRAFVDFLVALNGDAGLRDRLASAKASDQSDAVRQLIALGREAGFSFNEKEIDQLFQAAAAGPSSGELSVEELDAVAGGTGATQEMTHAFNLQYLQLQQSMQQENRQFTLLSNILKTKYDTAKSAIDNLR